MRYYVTIGDRTLEVDLTGATPVVEGRTIDAHILAVPGTPVHHLIVDGRSFPLTAHRSDRKNGWDLSVRGTRFSVDAVDERTRAIREMTGADDGEADKTISAPMPGLVLRVEVEVGQTVRAGDGLIVVEAMKMENELKAPADGVIAKIAVEAGNTVEKGTPLVILE